MVPHPQDNLLDLQDTPSALKSIHFLFTYVNIDESPSSSLSWKPGILKIMIFQKSSNNAIPYTLLAEDVTAQRRQPIAEGEQYVRDGVWTVTLSFWPQAQ